MEFEKLISGNVDLNGYVMMFPIIIIIYVITSSFIMQDICGLIYIFGITLTLLNVYAVSSMSNTSSELKNNYKKGNWEKSGLCYIGLPIINKYYNNASPNAAVIAFTLFFFLMGDIANNIREMKNPFGFGYFLISNKPWLIGFFSGMFALNILSEKLYYCNFKTTIDYFMGGGVIGLFTGILIMIFFIGAGLKNSLKTSSFLQISDRCITPLKKIFQCDKTSYDNDRVYFLKKEEMISNDSSIHSHYVDYLTPHNTDTYNISTLKNYGDYEKIVMTGETMVYFYEKENRKGNVVIIDKSGNVKGKGKFVKDDAEYDTVRSTDDDEDIVPTDKYERTISWSQLVDKFKKDWPSMDENFVGPQSILIHKEY
jgi:hypothetical protein